MSMTAPSNAPAPAAKVDAREKRCVEPGCNAFGSCGIGDRSWCPVHVHPSYWPKNRGEG